MRSSKSYLRDQNAWVPMQSGQAMPGRLLIRRQKSGNDYVNYVNYVNYARETRTRRAIKGELCQCVGHLTQSSRLQTISDSAI